ncbi:MAG: glycerophosphodiester phosphodiesterase [Candidatus Altimarinota bacterium]
MKNSKIEIVAHRGGSKGVYKENTLDAFYFALKNDIKSIEMDIRMSHFSKTFFLEHDYLHHPRVKKNFFEKIIKILPEDTVIYCELKTLTLTRKFYAQTFLDVIKKYGLEEKVVVISYNPFVLSQLRKIGYKGKIGILIGMNVMWKLLKNYVAKKIKPEYMIFSLAVINKSKINFARAKNYKVFVYVANKEKHWDQAVKLKLDGIITDYPLLLRDYLKS